MIHKELPALYERDLLKLKEEINLYKSEADLWVVKAEISNSGGNLCLHLIGNLNHFIGTTLGNTGYVRQRDLEFSRKNIDRKELNTELDKVIEVVNKTLSGLSAEDYEKNFPLTKHDKVVTTEHMLLHLLTHLNYHLGQVNYHRRLING
jgi:uncharacterized damage-inducible protein DinB